MNATTVIMAIQAAAAAYDLAIRIRDEAKRKGEMTPEEDAEFDRIMQSRMQLPHWRPTE
jgi:hypothetical protein